VSYNTDLLSALRLPHVNTMDQSLPSSLPAPCSIITDDALGQYNILLARSGRRTRMNGDHLGWLGGCEIRPGGTTTIQAQGAAVSTTGTVSTPALASTNLLTSTRTSLITSAASSNAVAEVHTNDFMAWFGNAAGLGGFYLCMRVAQRAAPATSGHFTFAGLASSTAALALHTTNPRNMVNCIGLGGDGNIATNDNLFLLNNDGAGAATTLDTGITLVMGTTSPIVQLELFVIPNTIYVTYRIMNLSDNTFVPLVGTLTTNLPSSTTFLALHSNVDTGIDTLAVRAHIARIVLDTDF